MSLSMESLPYNSPLLEVENLPPAIRGAEPKSAEESFAKRLIMLECDMLEEELRRAKRQYHTHGSGHGSYTPASVMAAEEIRYQLTGVQAQETAGVFIEENYPLSIFLRISVEVQLTCTLTAQFPLNEYGNNRHSGDIMR